MHCWMRPVLSTFIIRRDIFRWRGLTGLYEMKSAFEHVLSDLSFAIHAWSEGTFSLGGTQRHFHLQYLYVHTDFKLLARSLHGIHVGLTRTTQFCFQLVFRFSCFLFYFIFFLFGFYTNHKEASSYVITFL